MLASLRSAAVVGVDALPVVVEVDVAYGLPIFTMVGLPDASIRESRDRVRTAIRNSGYQFPHHRVTVNLAPWPGADSNAILQPIKSHNRCTIAKPKPTPLLRSWPGLSTW